MNEILDEAESCAVSVIEHQMKACTDYKDVVAFYTTWCNFLKDLFVNRIIELNALDSEGQDEQTE